MVIDVLFSIEVVSADLIVSKLQFMDDISTEEQSRFLGRMKSSCVKTQWCVKGEKNRYHIDYVEEEFD